MTLLDRLVAAYEQGCRIKWEFDDYAPMRATVRCLAKWIANNHISQCERHLRRQAAPRRSDS